MKVFKPLKGKSEIKILPSTKAGFFFDDLKERERYYQRVTDFICFNFGLTTLPITIDKRFTKKLGIFRGWLIKHFSPTSIGVVRGRSINKPTIRMSPKAGLCVLFHEIAHYMKAIRFGVTEVSHDEFFDTCHQKVKLFVQANKTQIFALVIE